MNRQFLSFTLGETLYAVEVDQVQEVLEYSQPVRLPCTIDYVEGLISSRDQGISVVNLRKKFDLPLESYTRKTRIIILETVTPEATQTITFGAIDRTNILIASGLGILSITSVLIPISF